MGGCVCMSPCVCVCVGGGGGVRSSMSSPVRPKLRAIPRCGCQSPADQCGNSPCDFCCTSHEMMAAGGICPVPLAADV